MIFRPFRREKVSGPIRGLMGLRPFSNLVSLYYKIEKYSKALSFYERDLEIVQCSLPDNHPDLQIHRENLEEARQNL